MVRKTGKFNGQMEKRKKKGQYLKDFGHKQDVKSEAPNPV